ncbi:acetyl-CoA C-acyltransferase family protein [Methylobacterium sp. J-077]|uniref:acetyl-CoA C-acyltransferase family protein n=1 Tax=Methylobacterium sp. J-077 TaxID=2836656 RepID=UPI001FBBB1B3|nr:acetyl-CoA C-acyltransferase family protein [Methylobacterium sp. J-077]MCJ2127047.1 acetyl-CoA C-acyltransferase family protein [Methylobacterium sp. J-077]
MTDVVITGAVRTAIGTFGGSLAAVPPAELAAKCVAEALKRSGTAPEAVGHVVLGHVIPTEPRDAYIARVAAIEGGVPKEVPALTVNRLCGSGLQAIVSAAQAIMLGDAEIAVAGGAESMSRSPHLLKTGRFGQRMGDAALVDYMVGVLNDPFGHGHMGVTAENVAERYGILRTMQDDFAAESQARAARAIREGRFRDQILPIEVQRKRETVAFDTDEHPKATSAEDLAKLRPAFSKTGSVTAGNASGLNDGAAILVLASAAAAERDGSRPLARIVGYAHAGVDPSEMGMGPVPAVQRLLARTGLRAADFDVIESNEAFAAQACAVSRALDLDPGKVNVNGGAIALGHPLGATGAIVTVKALYELARVNGRYGLITMCIGGGQGIAMAIERVH